MWQGDLGARKTEARWRCFLPWSCRVASQGHARDGRKSSLNGFCNLRERSLPGRSGMDPSPPRLGLSVISHQHHYHHHDHHHQPPTRSRDRQGESLLPGAAFALPYYCTTVSNLVLVKLSVSGRRPFGEGPQIMPLSGSITDHFPPSAPMRSRHLAAISFCNSLVRPDDASVSPDFAAETDHPTTTRLLRP